MTSGIKEKHLDLLQGVINRLASNSFLLKGWSLTLVASLLALSANSGDQSLVVIALLPALAFWGLDGYFLAQERLFRQLYGQAIEPDSDLPPYSMKTEPLTPDFWREVCWSITLRAFHGSVVVVLLAVLLL